MIEVKNVTNDKKGIKDFINLPFELYKDDKNWVPPLKSAVKEMLDKEKNPFFEHGEGEFFVAYKDGKPVGRITAQYDKLYNEKYNEKQGNFGFYESINDIEVFKALVETAEKWNIEHKMETCIGPFNFSLNQEIGFLSKGFERRPVLEMPWTKKYYIDLFKRSGYEAKRRLFSYIMENVTSVPEVVSKHAEKLRKKYGDRIEIKTLNMKNLKQETRQMFDIFNEAWDGNWGFVPMTDKEVEKTVADVKMIADPRIMYFIYKDGELAGTLVGIPDINEFMVNNRSGSMLSPKLLWNMLFGIKKVRKIRIIIMGVRQKFRRLGLDFLMLDQIFTDGLKHTNYKDVEMGWILDSNKQMNSTMERLNAKPENEYLLFSKNLKG